jgi:hypothetical protein
VLERVLSAHRSAATISSSTAPSSALRGGTASLLTGGKFAAGFITAAFANLYNKNAKELRETMRDVRDTPEDPEFPGKTYHEYTGDPLLVCSAGQAACTFDNVKASLLATQVPPNLIISYTMGMLSELLRKRATGFTSPVTAKASI